MKSKSQTKVSKRSPKTSVKSARIFTLIKQDHRTVENLFEQIEKMGERASKKREKVYLELRQEITNHSHAEEKGIYPKLKKATTTEDIAFESVEEHGLVKVLLRKLDSTPADSKQWTALVTVLKEVIGHHVEEEEEEMFKQMRKAFDSAALEQMAREFEELKASFVGEEHSEVAA